MSKLNYEQLAFLLVQECNSALSLIRESGDYKGLYAFCIDLDPDNGSYRISWNTESAFGKTAEYYKNSWGYTHESLYQFFWGTKYNSGDFNFHLDMFQEQTSGLSKLDNLLHAHSELCLQLVRDDEEEQIKQLEKKVINQGVQAINQLNFRGIDCTEDFIAFVTLHDADDETRLNLLRQTLSSQILDKIDEQRLDP